MFKTDDNSKRNFMIFTEDNSFINIELQLMIKLKNNIKVIENN